MASISWACWAIGLRLSTQRTLCSMPPPGGGRCPVWRCALGSTRGLPPWLALGHHHAGRGQVQPALARVAQRPQPARFQCVQTQTPVALLAPGLSGQVRGCGRPEGSLVQGQCTGLCGSEHGNNEPALAGGAHRRAQRPLRDTALRKQGALSARASGRLRAVVKTRWDERVAKAAFRGSDVQALEPPTQLQAKLRTGPVLLSQWLTPRLPDGGVDWAVRGRQASSDPAPAEAVFS